VDGFIRLHELGMSMQVNTTVTVYNRDQLGEMYELVRKLGADAWHLFLLVPVGCGLEIESNAQLTPREYEEVLYWIDDVAREETMEVRATCAPHAQRVRLQRDAVAGEQAEVEVKGEGENRRFRQLFTQPQPQPEPASQVRRGCLAGTGICFISHDGKVFPCGYLPMQAGDVRQQSFSLIWSSSPLFEDLRNPDRLMGKCGVCEYRVVCGGCRARAFGRTGRLLDEEPFCNYLPATQMTAEPHPSI
jgi:radical SAM protein with 4Fe4S-binding SPASM domain